MTERVVGAIETSVNQAEITRARAKTTSNLDAYDYYLRALHQLTVYTRPSSDAMMENIQKAISLDPDYALAKALLSSIYMTRWIQGWGTRRSSQGVGRCEGGDRPGHEQPFGLEVGGPYAWFLGRS